MTGPDLAKIVTSDGKAPVVTDGPFQEFKEWLAGFIDQCRSDRSRRAREAVAVAQACQTRVVSDRDDTLTVLFMCCHPALTPASAIALTLRAVGGLTTAEVARAFLVDETRSRAAAPRRVAPRTSPSSAI